MGRRRFAVPTASPVGSATGAVFPWFGRSRAEHRIGLSLLLITGIVRGLSQFTCIRPSDRNTGSMTGGQVVACNQLDPLFIWAMTSDGGIAQKNSLHRG